jgi:predicted Zn-dependent protease
LEINPSAIGYLQFLGSLLFEAGHHEEAETTFMRLKTLAPDMPETYENLAILYRKKNQMENAEQFLREGITRIPAHAPFYVLWAEILSEQGKRAQAIENYLKALHYQPDNALVLRDLGGLLAETGQLNESVQTLQKAIVLDDKLWDAWYLLGQIYEYQKAAQEAVTAYQNVLRIKPDHVGSKERLARLSHP